MTQRSYWEALQHDPSRVPAVVEEMLRFDGPVFGVFRLTTQDVQVHGMTIPKDALVFLALGSANHDETVFSDAELFSPQQEPTSPHLAFGYGTHFCVGAPLARLEVRIALELLSQRLPTLRLVEGEQVRYRPAATLGRVMLTLPVEWEIPAVSAPVEQQNT